MLEKLKRQKGNTAVIEVITAGSSPTPGAREQREEVR